MNLNYNLEGYPFGRICSFLAKKLLEGNKVNVFNFEKVIILGNLFFFKKKYQHRFSLGTKRKGPFYEKTIKGIFLRGLRGMLPMKKKRGKKAYSRLNLSRENFKNFQINPIPLQNKEINSSFKFFKLFEII